MGVRIVFIAPTITRIGTRRRTNLDINYDLLWVRIIIKNSDGGCTNCFAFL